MSQETTNYNLKKPEATDLVLITITDLSNNFDEIDTLIKNVNDHLVNQWAAWTCNPIWNITPSGSVTQVARFAQDGKVCFFNYYYQANNGNNATAVAIPLPVVPKDNSSYIPLQSQQRVGSNWITPLAYINDGGTYINFRTLSTCTSGEIIELFISGMYEINL